MNSSLVNKSILYCIVLLFFCSSPSCAQPDWELNAGVQELYDDNITYTHTNEKKDFITSLFVGGTLFYESKGQLMSLGATITQNIFAKYNKFNNSAQYADFSYKREVSKYVALAVRDVFSHSEDPQSFEDAFGRTSGRYSYFKNNFDLDITADVSKQIQVITGYTNQINEVSSDNVHDSMLQEWRLSGNYYYSSALLMGPYYAYSVRDFDPGDSITKHRVGGQMRKYMTPTFFGDGGVGIDIIDTTANKVHPYATLSITNAIDENTSITASGRYEYVTQTYSEDIFRNLRFSVSGNRQFSERMAGSVNGFMGFGEYTATDRRERLYGTTAQLSYDITKYVQGIVTYSFSVVDSNVSTSEYMKNVVMIGIKAKLG